MTFKELRALQAKVEKMATDGYPPEMFTWEGDLGGVSRESLAKETTDYMNRNPVRASVPFTYDSKLLGRSVTTVAHHEFIADLQRRAAEAAKEMGVVWRPTRQH